jgi:hypothetical protein
MASFCYSPGLNWMHCRIPVRTGYGISIKSDTELWIQKKYSTHHLAPVPPVLVPVSSKIHTGSTREPDKINCYVKLERN